MIETIERSWKVHDYCAREAFVIESFFALFYKSQNSILRDASRTKLT